RRHRRNVRALSDADRHDRPHSARPSSNAARVRIFRQGSAEAPTKTVLNISAAHVLNSDKTEGLAFPRSEVRQGVVSNEVATRTKGTTFTCAWVFCGRGSTLGR